MPCEKPELTSLLASLRLTLSLQPKCCQNTNTEIVYQQFHFYYANQMAGILCFALWYNLMF
eukprot:1218227-Rhodomonas_salina.1